MSTKNQNLNASAQTAVTVSQSYCSDVSHADNKLAAKALFEFNRGNYADSFSILSTLELTRSNDVKIKHNKAVCEYFARGLRGEELFSKTITELLMQHSFENKGHGRVPEWSGSVESSVAAFNLAVISYHNQQYSRAVQLLSPLYASLESLDESVGIKVCLLLASCYLFFSRPDHALTVLRRTENTFLPSQLLETEHSILKEEDSAICQTSLAAEVSSSQFRSGSVERETLPQKIAMLRVRALLALHFVKLSAKEFKAIIQVAAAAGDQLELSQISYKSEIKLARGQPLKALKVLNTVNALTDSMGSLHTGRRNIPSLNVWYNNNLALIYFGLRKPANALFYLLEAVEQFRINCTEELKDKKELSLYDNPARVSNTLSYNLACLLLHRNLNESMPRRAFDLFLQVLQFHPCNPRLWLHLAQCCIALHNWKLALAAERHVPIEVFGSGLTRKVLLRPIPRDRFDEPVTDAAFPEPRLPYARLCLHNALLLLPPASTHFEDTDAVSCAGVGSSSSPSTQVFPSDPSLPMRIGEALRVRSTVLLCASYTALCLGEYQTALAHATSLLSSLPPPDSSSAASWAAANPSTITYRYLGKLYASESCVMLNKMNDALRYLDLQDLKDSSSRPSLSIAEDWSSSNGYRNKAETDAFFELKFNLCLVFSLRREFNKSAMLLDELFKEYADCKSLALIMLGIFVKLKLGDVSSVRRIIESHLMKAK